MYQEKIKPENNTDANFDIKELEDIIVLTDTGRKNKRKFVRN
jgi:hypothetical protein